MAVSPEKYVSSFKSRIYDAEKYIDQQLLSNTSRFGKSILVNVKGITQHEFETFLKQKYIDVGWSSAEYKCDEPLDYIQFSFPTSFSKNVNQLTEK